MTAIPQEGRVLVVGGAGFVGSNLVAMLLDRGVDSVVVVDNLLSAERDNIPDDARVQFVEGSIADDAVLARLSDDFDVIFHLATYHGNQSSIHDPLADHENNTLTTLKLCNHVSKFRRLQKLVYAGAGCAAAIKTQDAAQATREDAPIHFDQDSPYSISKLIGEFYAVYFHRQFGLPTVRARFQNVYGPGEMLGAGQWRGTPATVWRNVTPTFIYKALHKQTLPLHDGGSATRDFIYVEDICRGLIACAEHGVAGDVYNLATGREHTVLSWASLINELAENPAPPTLLPRRSWDHSGARFGCPEKSRRVLGFATQTDAREGLARTIAWTRKHLDVIEACMRKHAHRMVAAQAA